jgi:hypothetical protein
MIVVRVAPEMIGVAGEETMIMTAPMTMTVTMTTATIMTMTTTTTIRTRPVTVAGR